MIYLHHFHINRSKDAAKTFGLLLGEGLFWDRKYGYLLLLHFKVFLWIAAP